MRSEPSPLTSEASIGYHGDVYRSDMVTAGVQSSGHGSSRRDARHPLLGDQKVVPHLARGWRHPVAREDSHHIPIDYWTYGCPALGLCLQKSGGTGRS